MPIKSVSVDKSLGNFDRVYWDALDPGDEGEPLAAGGYSALCIHLRKSGTPTGSVVVDGSVDGGANWFPLATDGGANSVYRVVDNPPELVRARATSNMADGSSAYVNVTAKFGHLAGRC